MSSLADKVGPVVGIADEPSTAWGRTACGCCAKAFPGARAALLVRSGARAVTGGVHHIDGGCSITGS